MVQYYNENKAPDDTKININLLAELPNMDEAYKYVVDYGKKSKDILSEYVKELNQIDIPDKFPNIKEAVHNLSTVATEKLSGIDEKFKAIVSDDNVRLCFSGVFSSGKSSIINSILGYPILPEAIHPETAKTFSIQSPKDGDAARIECKINVDGENQLFIVSWNGSQPTITSRVFENDTKKALQDIINNRGDKPMHVQMNEVIKCLNEAEDVSTRIDVYFPIPLDDENVHFTIFDTPGTDAGNEEHQRVLLDALSSQTHSILIFVASVNTLEGSGNRALMDYLKSAENNKSKTSIDIGRSLFVINWSDSVFANDREALKKGKLGINIF